jgi:hypothetical protein
LRVGVSDQFLLLIMRKRWWWAVTVVGFPFSVVSFQCTVSEKRKKKRTGVRHRRQRLIDYERGGLLATWRRGAFFTAFLLLSGSL